MPMVYGDLLDAHFMHKACTTHARHACGGRSVDWRIWSGRTQAALPIAARSRLIASAHCHPLAMRGRRRDRRGPAGEGRSVPRGRPVGPSRRRWCRRSGTSDRVMTSAARRTRIGRWEDPERHFASQSAAVRGRACRAGSGARDRWPAARSRQTGVGEHQRARVEVGAGASASATGSSSRPMTTEARRYMSRDADDREVVEAALVLGVAQLVPVVAVEAGPRAGRAPPFKTAPAGALRHHRGSPRRSGCSGGGSGKCRCRIAHISASTAR